VRRLLVKLQAVFNLPKRLRTAIDQGAVEIAVNAYADAAPLLKRNGHKVSLLASKLTLNGDPATSKMK
jgi:vacuolar protein sorting-associated protein 51